MKQSANHPQLPPGAQPVTEVNGARIAILPPARLDDPQHILIENTLHGLTLAYALDPEWASPPRYQAGGYLYVPQTREVGANIVHLIDTLAELQRRSPNLVQLPLVNFKDVL